MSKGERRMYSGRLVDPFDMTPEDVLVGDMAHGLSLLCRFGGSVRQFYPVAEHCLNVRALLRSWGCSLYVQALGLTHDCWEAYLGADVPSPVKWRWDGVRAAETHGLACIFSRLGLREPTEAEWYHVERADALMAQVEGFELVPGWEGPEWTLPAMDIECMSPLLAEVSWLQAFHELFPDYVEEQS